MDSRTKLQFRFIALITAFATFCCLGQQENMEPQPTPSTEPNVVALPPFPYFAEIVSDNVYVRSGPGTNYYRCGKLGQGQIVKIVSASNVWSQILPPKDSFSWISKQYVSIDTANPDVGVVTGDEVRVYAGSQYYEPIHSDRIQVHLNRGDKVTLLGEEMGDYYKIVPPDGAFFWVSTQYTRPVEIKTPPAETGPAAELQPQPQPEVKPGPTLPPSPAVAPSTMPADSERLGQYYQTQEQIKAELTKPLDQQNYEPMKQALNALVTADGSDKAGRYAKFSLGQVARYELAAAVEKENALQNAELKQIYEKITQAQNEKLADFQDLGRFAVVGTFGMSNVYGPEEVLLHYIIVDQRGKVICYALPTGDAEHTDLNAIVGQKVGLIGEIDPHPQTAGALVKFTEIQPVK